MRELTHLDLFSGIGGFALAARWAGIKTVQFVEIDPFCQKVLNKNFPGVPIHDDIKTFTYAESKGFQGSEKKQRNGNFQQWDKVGEGFRASDKIPIPDVRNPHNQTGGQVPQSGSSLRDGVINTRFSGSLRDNTTGDVEDSQGEGMPVSGKPEIRNGEPLLQGNEGIRQGTESIGTGNRGRKDTKTDNLSEVRGIGNIQGRTDDDSSASSRLRETLGSDVVMPTMSPRNSQGKYGKGGDQNGIQPQERPFILTGGFP